MGWISRSQIKTVSQVDRYDQINLLMMQKKKKMNSEDWTLGLATFVPLILTNWFVGWKEWEEVVKRMVEFFIVRIEDSSFRESCSQGQ